MEVSPTMSCEFFPSNTSLQTYYAYKILGINLTDAHEDILEEFDCIGQIIPYTYEDLIKKVPAIYKRKIEAGLKEADAGLFDLTDEEKRVLQEEGFITYDEFLHFLEMKNIKFARVSELNKKPQEPEFVDIEELDICDPKAAKFITRYERAMKKYETDLEIYWKKCQLDDENYAFNHPAFLPYFRDFFNILTQQAYDFFCSEYPPTIEGYMALLERSSATKLRAFFFKTRLWAFIRGTDRARHTFITGSSGSGKSELLKFLIYADLKKPKRKTHIVLIDPNGDLAEQTVKMALASGIDPDDIIYFDPYLSPTHTPCINPLQTNDKSEKNLDRFSQEICKVFDAILNTDSGLSNQMKALFIPCVTSLLHHGNASFIDLQRFMGEKTNEPYINIGKKSPISTHRQFFNFGFHESAYKPTKASIYTKLQSLLNSSVFVNMTTGKTTIDLFEILNSRKRKLIVFKLSKGAMGAEISEAFGRFLLGIISVIGMQRSDLDEKNRVQVNLLVDEFQNYAGGNTLKEALAELRKYRIADTLACQYPGQLDTETQKAVFSNTHVKIIGQQQDPANISLLSKTIGAPIEIIESLSLGNFLVKNGEKSFFKLSVPDMVIERHRELSKEAWKNFISLQLEKYYRPNPTLSDITPLTDLNEIQDNTDIPEIPTIPEIKSPRYTNF